MILFFYEAQIMEVVIPSTEDKGERGKLEKTRESPQEVLEEEGGECPQGKASGSLRSFMLV